MAARKTTKQVGIKHDSDKTMMGIMIIGFAGALKAVGEVATFGAKKYGKHNWKEVEDGEDRYTDAMYRHLMDGHSGIDYDDETGLRHAAHAAWNALARLQLIIDKEG